ncbi:MAG: EscU/YscU/HrcU family type III secretion system export apparatus switch protein [Acidobacteria bacterium]|nr:EscU/YscU/HrcU family type III secretion system export apparatus switch protein [Acidobacteriota bacterium]
MADKGQKTHQPTARRLEKAREEGQFLTSREFVSGFQFLAVVAVVAAWGGSWMEEARLAFAMLFKQAFQPVITPADVTRLTSHVLSHVFLPLGLAGAVVLAVTMMLQMAVTQGGFSGKRLMPNFARMNPFTKLPQIPKQTLPAAAQATVMIVVFGFVIYLIGRRNVEMLFLLPLSPVAAGAQKIWGSVLELLWKAAALFVVLGCVDLLRQKRRFTNDMKMTLQEVRDEMKDSEGNPHIKSRIRRLRRDLLRRQMMRAVPTATAVIVNPTHFAVALKYDRDSMSTPMVVAKGKNFLALRIRQKAIENQIPLIENPPLAQALYKSCEVGQEIPAAFYRAVAEVLAYVYRLMNLAARR